VVYMAYSYLSAKPIMYAMLYECALGGFAHMHLRSTSATYTIHVSNNSSAIAQK
jgi:hypothetical protein